MANSNPIFQFEDAERVKLKASIMIQGLSGSGKSGLALLLGLYLAGSWDKVFDIDTENKSANLFAGIPFSNGNPVGKFKVGQLTEDIGFKPSNYVAYREAAKAAGAEVVIEDSISHAWQYQGGVLDLVTEAANKSSNKNDKYAAWRNETVAHEKNTLLTMLRDSDVHVITTVRVKEKFEYVEEDGKNKLKSMGEQQIQQADLKYEPDLVLSMVRAGSATTPPRAEVIKSRYAILEVGQEYDFNEELCLQLKAYLEEGADPDELLEKQRLDYISAIKDFLNTHPTQKNVWEVYKEDAGVKDIKLNDINLETLKKLYVKLTSD